MSLKKRVIFKLESLLDDIVSAMDTMSFISWRNFFQTLKCTQELCVNGLPKEKYESDYKEIYEGLSIAVEAMVRGENQQYDVLKICKDLLKYVIKIAQNEQRFKREMVFLPYKASMWDSLESIWMAALEDSERVLTYVIPIPYADLDENGHAKIWHVEKDLFPPYVHTLNWQDVDLEKWHPDAIFIHYPYDGSNLITSIEQRYYTKNLKHFTDLLVYSPYYVTTGGLGEGQRDCVSYPNIDYIIVQSQGVCDCFAPSIPREKLVPLGSPKLDRVIRLSENPPEPPLNWRKKLEGKKVYFYNTSLSYMFYDTAAYLQKMVYVFKIFAERKDACLIWRPHPLMEATIAAKRPQFLDSYEKVKNTFIEADFGIFDDTPNIDETIALSDAYIGDAGTSVTMLFGIVGKPMFILENQIRELPTSEDWRGLIGEIMFYDKTEWIATGRNRLYHKNPATGKYRYVCKLNDYCGGSYYSRVIEINNDVFVCPVSAQNILMVTEKGLKAKIPLEHRYEGASSFTNALLYGRYIILIPFLYPAIVIFDTVLKNASYISGYNQIFVKIIFGERRIGGYCIWRDKLLLASPDTPEVVLVDLTNGSAKVITIDNMKTGVLFMVVDNDDVWLIPSQGYTVCKWNPETGEVCAYSAEIEGITSHLLRYKYECDDFVFGRPAFDENYLYLPPYWGNRFVRLNKVTGEADEWNAPFVASIESKSSYLFAGNIANFLDEIGKGHWRMFYTPERRCYDVNLKTGESIEIPLEFEDGELLNEATGFTEQTEWLRYGCMENAFQTLPDFIEGKLPGEPHDKDRQIRAYSEVAMNVDGSAGQKTYQFVMEKLDKKRGCYG